MDPSQFVSTWIFPILPCFDPTLPPTNSLEGLPFQNEEFDFV